MKLYKSLQCCNDSSAEWNSVKFSHYAIQRDIHYYVKLSHNTIEVSLQQQLYFFRISECTMTTSYIWGGQKIIIYRCEIASRFCVPRIILLKCLFSTELLKIENSSFLWNTVCYRLTASMCANAMNACQGRCVFCNPLLSCRATVLHFKSPMVLSDHTASADGFFYAGGCSCWWDRQSGRRSLLVWVGWLAAWRRIRHVLRHVTARVSYVTPQLTFVHN